MRGPRETGRRFDWPIVVSAAVLSAVGLVAVYSATEGGDVFWRQLLWVGAGWAAMAAALAVPYRFTVRWSWVPYAAAVAMLAYLAAKAVVTGGAAYRWLSFGPLTFQPSEVAKVATVLALAAAANLLQRLDNVPRLLAAVALAAVPAALVAVEPDLATAVMFVPILFAGLYAAGAPLLPLVLLATPLAAVFLSFKVVPFLVFLAVVAAAAAASRVRWWERGVLFALNAGAGLATPLLWGMLKGYQRARIMNFLAPGSDPRGEGYSSIQAKIALGSGRLFGKGFLEGSQVHLKFLPAGHTDFVLPTFGEEFGFVGCALVVVLFAVIVGRALFIAYRAADRGGAVVALSLGVWLACQFAVNAAMATGLLPVAGVPMPFVSYGGTITVAAYVAVGLILNVKLRRERVADELKLRGHY